jgi:hypothetical protein
MPCQTRRKLLSYTVVIAASLSMYTGYTGCFAEEEIKLLREGAAPVSGFARNFITGVGIANATITILETSQQMNTDQEGRFGPISYPIGKPITLVFNKFGYKTTQSGTVIVPPGGLTGPYDNLTFQVPTIETYYLFVSIVGAKIDADSCHVTTTITAYQKTLDNVPQGEPDAKITLAPYSNETPFYFDIFNIGPLKGKTNPFTKGLTVTSEDGGVAFFNLPPREKPYVISAVKAGVVFTEAQFLCRSGAFINISPPRGPMAQK